MNMKESFESRGKAIAQVFIGIAKAIQRSITPNAIYIEQFEKRELYTQMKTTFDSSTVQKRYDDIVTALKYTKHSKKRERLLKAKRMYEKSHIMEG